MGLRGLTWAVGANIGGTADRHHGHRVGEISL